MSESTESTVGYFQRAWSSVFRKGSAEDRKAQAPASAPVPGQPLSVRTPDLDTPAWLEINAMNKMVRESGHHLETQKRVEYNSRNLWTSK